jgi:RNA polymerase sigma-70 factor (ECF subfamily)
MSGQTAILTAADRLLAKLNAGDAEAAGQMFRTFEPYLRMVIRRRISQRFRAKFDSADIVQSVWADVVDGLRQSKWTFENVGQLRAFLVKMTRNRFVDRVRQHRRAIDQESTMPPHDIETLAAIGSGRVSENLYADELWHQMIRACPSAHYELLYLKRQGASLDEIAARTGLHKGSVRRILYQIGRDVARLRATQNPDA